MVVLTADQVGQMIWKDQFGHSILRPILLTDGRYALPESVLTSPVHARWRHILKQGTIEDAGSLTFDTTIGTSSYRADIDGKGMVLYIGGVEKDTYHYPAPNLFDIPAEGTYRFAPKYNNGIGSLDRGNNRRRVELIQYDTPYGYAKADEVWVAWSTVVTDKRAGLDDATTAIIQQWHANVASTFAPPFLATGLHDGNLFINLRTSEAAAPQGQGYSIYSEAAPASWEATHFVIHGAFGAGGHIGIWINGVEVIDDDHPFGYYSEDLTPFTYLQWGIYQDNVRTEDVIYHCNMEFGTDDLSARIDTPLPLNAPSGGWPTLDEVYPDTDVYPVTNLYPMS